MTIDAPICHVTKPGTNLLRELGFTPDEADAAQRLMLPMSALSLAASVIAAWLLVGAPVCQAQTDSVAASAPASAPRYSASNLALAFSYMDTNHDGKISREEAAGFSGVARHFDQADTNHDGFLSREEFDYAMNYVKPH